MEITLSWLVITLAHLARSDVYCTDGAITITDLDNCSFHNNGMEYNGTGPGRMPGLFFGLIEYSCTNTKGILVSKLSCKDCGLYCNYNQMIDGCQSYWIPFLTGSAIVMILLLLLCSVPKVRTFFNKIVIYIIESVMYCWTRCQDKKEMRKINQMMARNVRGVEPSFNRPINKHPKFINKINSKRATSGYLTIELSTLKPLDVVASAPEANTYDVIGEKREESNVINPTMRKYPSLTALIVGAAVLTTIPPVIDCCDNTLYISSNGKICDSTHCVEHKMYDMPLLTGSITCFKDMEGEMMKIRVDDSYWRSRYNLLYKTSDIQLDVYQTWSCKGAGECYMGKCEHNTVNKQLENERNGSIHGYGCYTNGLGCDTWCLHELSCVWYKWAMTSTGSHYPVYQKSTDLWEVVISVDYKGVITKHTVNVNNPRVNLDGIFSTMPIYVSGFSSAMKHAKNGLVIIDNIALESTVSDINMPQTDIIGDYQISLDNSTHIYNDHEVKCLSTSCSTKCMIPEPKVRRLKRRMDSAIGLEYSYVGGKYIIETKKRVNSLIRVMIGNVDFNNLQVDPAKCDIDISMTYSCIGCETSPYIVFQSTNIVSEGIVPIVSNCTLSTKFVSCSRDPYKIELMTDEKKCLINMPTLNRTVIADFEFSFKGTLDPTTSLYAVETSEQIMKTIATSPMFIQGIVGTFSTVTLITVSASLLARIIKVWQFNKLASEQSKA